MYDSSGRTPNGRRIRSKHLYLVAGERRADAGRRQRGRAGRRVGRSLAAMVGRLTAGRPKYATVDDQMQSAIVEADTLRSRLLALVDEDAAAYDQVRAAYRLPKETVEQQAIRAAAIQQALQGASRTPLATVEACLAVLRLAEQVVRSGNPNAATDGAVGALLAHAGLHGAALNVHINLGGIDDTTFVADSQAAVETALAKANALQRANHADPCQLA